MSKRSVRNLRMVIVGLCTAIGGSTMFTRDPSGQAGVDHRRALVQAPPERGGDAVGDAPDVLGVAEADRAHVEHAVALVEDLATGRSP